MRLDANKWTVFPGYYNYLHVFRASVVKLLPRKSKRMLSAMIIFFLFVVFAVSNIFMIKRMLRLQQYQSFVNGDDIPRMRSDTAKQNLSSTMSIKELISKYKSDQIILQDIGCHNGFFPQISSANISKLQPIMLTPFIKEKRRLVFAIPVVSRHYILETMQSLFSSFCPCLREQVLFVMMFANPTDTEWLQNTAVDILSYFSKEIQDGLLEAFIIPPLWHQLLLPDSFNSTFRDSNERMLWRTKQNLDYFYLMNYASRKADYYMQLEDDILATAKYSKTIMNYINLKEGGSWFSMLFSRLGFIGKLFRSDDVKYITNAIAAYYKIKPVDWIFSDVERNLFCSPEYNDGLCQEACSASRVTVIPAQFQHMGKSSSLNGKKQWIKERFFNRSCRQCKRRNPFANITSTMPTHSSHTLEGGYYTYDFMWFTSVNKGDHLMISFGYPLKLTGILMVSGVDPALHDVFSSDTQLFAVKKDKNEVLLANFTIHGDLMTRLAGTEVIALILRVNSNHSTWVILAHIEIDVE
ncbi:unnamed protein product [Cylicocyclus nassatus]|uniref:MGAT4 conserved region domain-containing protein n=1 Tax=Cylicocyclus nassatus TaxID=53992 RepID=A0AA36DN39_CYLNA|nr:unnamed protein product [Cylicocyclus nassatus]